jgi:hypothetical protein
MIALSPTVSRRVACPISATASGLVSTF